MTEDDEQTTTEPPAHVPGQINLEGEVEDEKPVGPPEGMEFTSDGPRRIDRFTNTVEDAAWFERNS
jgi:hypothetical protein